MSIHTKLLIFSIVCLIFMLAIILTEGIRSGNAKSMQEFLGRIYSRPFQGLLYRLSAYGAIASMVCVLLIG